MLLEAAEPTLCLVPIETTYRQYIYKNPIYNPYIIPPISRPIYSIAGGRKISYIAPGTYNYTRHKKRAVIASNPYRRIAGAAATNGIQEVCPAETEAQAKVICAFQASVVPPI